MIRSLVAALLVLVAAPIAAQETTQTTVIFLVRHAEKVDGGEDPALSEAGRERVRALVRMFADAGLTAVHTTPYQRTRDTAAPIAAAHGLTPREYDPHAAADFAQRLAGAGGRHLVVGHSNTIPELVRLLGGAAEPMQETEYGRFYQVTIGPDGVHTVVLGYPE